MDNVTERKYTVSFADGGQIDVLAELKESDAFDYGNGSMVVLTEKGSQPRSFDVRYCAELDRYGRNFKDWAAGFVASQYPGAVSVKASGE